MIFVYKQNRVCFNLNFRNVTSLSPVCSATDMGLLGFLVELDNTSNTVYSGSENRGRVIIRLDKPNQSGSNRRREDGVV